MIRSYRVDGGVHARAIRRTSMPVSIVTSVLAIGGLCLFRARDVSQTGDDFFAGYELPFVVVSVVLTIGVAFSYWNAGRTGRELAESFALAIGPNVARRAAKAYTTAEVLRGDVAEIQENRLGLLLLTRERAVLMHVPRSLIGYDEVKETLLTWPKGVGERDPTELQRELEAVRAMQPGTRGPIFATPSPTKSVAWIAAAFVLPWCLLTAMFYAIRWFLGP